MQLVLFEPLPENISPVSGMGHFGSHSIFFATTPLGCQGTPKPNSGDQRSILNPPQGRSFLGGKTARWFRVVFVIFIRDELIVG